ncbi:MAG: helix-turn-helix domain-containing protein, partial [Pedobacter sp.]|nr:helix-turn-helix domain-containing protein [Pedobacter sp.]
ERHFKFHVGISPKEFANLTRYQFASESISKNSTQSTLLQIALEHGYYDHAHLTNEIKKYTGVTPSSLTEHIKS